MLNPQFFFLTGGGPAVTDSQGHPWSGKYVTANGDLTVDFRGNMASECRPGVLQGDPRYRNNFFNLSTGPSSRGPWNEGENRLGEEWQYIEDSIEHVRESKGMLKQEPTGTPLSMEEMENKNGEMSKKKSKESKSGVPKGANQWSAYPQEKLESPTDVEES